MLSHLVNETFSTCESIFFPLAIPKKCKTRRFKRVLIIDGDRKMCHLLKAFLQQDVELKVSTAQDPFEAMDMMTAQAFDLIVIEWNLPKLNGLETLLATERGFKFEPNLPLEWDEKKVPVIILSDCEKSSCKAPYTKHFRYLAYINKAKSIEQIVGTLKFHFQRAA